MRELGHERRKIYPEYESEEMNIEPYEKPYFIESLFVNENKYDYLYHNACPQCEYKGHYHEKEFFFDDCNIYQYITFPIKIVEN